MSRHPPFNLGGPSNLNDLTSVTNAGPDDIWASGFDAASNFRSPYLLHWTGTAWTLVQVPNAGSEGTQLEGVTAVSASDVWVAGATVQADGGELALTEQFNGTSWSIVPSLDPGQLADLPDNTLLAIATAGPSTLVTVGSELVPGHLGLLPLTEGTTAG